MKKYASLLLLCATPVLAAEGDYMTITVEGTHLSDVSGEELKSADLAEALSQNSPSVSLVRRSGIANDIILRGQKKDNINILIDGAKIYGACPNRMDPPTSHVLTNNIEGIDIIEGPFDVENFGTLSGAVHITTKKPAQELQGEVGLNVGSWNYRKQYASVSAGTERVRFLLSASQESSDQYEDGDGNNFYEQIEALDPNPATVQYKDQYKDLEAYSKSTLMGKLFVDVTDKQELRLSYTANRSDDILYPSSKMDAMYDDSDIFNAEYTMRDLGEYSKSLDFQYYNSKVDHPMSTFYRLSSGITDSSENITSALTSEMQGFKVKNLMALNERLDLTLGLDASRRNWDGTYTKEGAMAATITGRKSMNDVDTDNRAIFAELEQTLEKFTLRYGLRYDDTAITPADTIAQQENDYSSVNGFAFATYQHNESTRYFAGIGKASRVPDARELYFLGGMGVPQPEVGTPDLEQVINTELDLGVEKRYQNVQLKAKVFHSWLKDYIYYNADKAVNAFENIDATIYGASFNGSWFINDTLSMDFGLAYQRGQKDEALAGQSDTDLAEITPTKLNLALNYDYAARSTAKLELVAADKWSNYDEDNGEQAIDAYQILNLKVQHALTQAVELTLGVDNITDETYATTNTYQDLTLLFDTAGDVMLLNEPGRYVYLNAAYKF